MNKWTAGKQRTNQRIQSVECCRLILSVLVVFIHCEGAGTFGTVMNCLARVAVPFFFAVSGYFAYHISGKTIKKRLWSVFKLNIVANLLYLLWGGYHNGIRELPSFAKWCAQIYFSESNLFQILLINRNPIRGYLWYLNAIVLCYIALWMYVQWEECETCNYKPLYITSVCLYFLQVVLSSIATASAFEVPHYMYRNALLFGMPMFSLGIFLRENYHKIWRVYKLTKIKLIVLIAVGAWLSVLQWKGTGNVEMPIGTLLEVIALLLLLVSVPVISKESMFLSGIISTFGSLSTYVYITHLIWSDVYRMYVKEYALCLGEAVEAFLYPFFVAGLTLTTGILYVGIKAALKCFFGRSQFANCPDKR